MTPQAFDELSDDELNRIEQLIEAATAGPWISYVKGRDRYADSNFIEVGVCNELGCCRCIELGNCSTADLDFIASARQDLPRLLSEVRSLRARLYGASCEALSREPAPGRSASI